jgi:predicted aspartyl protease
MSLLKFTFKYTRIDNIFSPIIPVRFRFHNKETPVIDGILDTGSDFILISKGIGEYLNLKLEEWHPIGTSASGRFNTCVNRLDFIIGRGGREQVFENIKVHVSDEIGFPILPLIGRYPLFESYNFIFDNIKNVVELIPRSEEV